LQRLAVRAAGSPAVMVTGLIVSVLTLPGARGSPATVSSGGLPNHALTPGARILLSPNPISEHDLQGWLDQHDPAADVVHESTEVRQLVTYGSRIDGCRLEEDH